LLRKIMKTVSLKTKLMVVGLLALGAWGLWYLVRSPAKVPSMAASTAQGLALGAGGVGLKAVAGQGAADVVAGQAASTQAAPPQAATSQAATSQAAINQAAAARLQFATRLTGNQQVSYEGRAQDLLGVNPVSASDPAAGQMVTLQDRETGQLTYRLAGVRVVLVNPAQGDAFVAGNADMSRLFVNSQYVDAAVAPSRLAAVLGQLQADPRVARVDLMRYVAPAKPK
jgi:hypothetical protein